MSDKDILNKKIALVQNDISHYSRRLTELDNEINALNKKKNSFQIRISKKQSYIAQLEGDLSKINSADAMMEASKGGNSKKTYPTLSEVNDQAVKCGKDSPLASNEVGRTVGFSLGATWAINKIKKGAR